MPSDDIMTEAEIRACLERAEAASAAPLSNAEYRDKYGEAWRLVETDVPRLARTALVLSERCERLTELGRAAGALGDAMTNDEWVAAWTRHREAMHACESHGDLEER